MSPQQDDEQFQTAALPGDYYRDLRDAEDLRTIAETLESDEMTGDSHEQIIETLRRMADRRDPEVDPWPETPSKPDSSQYVAVDDHDYQPRSCGLLDWLRGLF